MDQSWSRWRGWWRKLEVQANQREWNVFLTKSDMPLKTNKKKQTQKNPANRNLTSGLRADACVFSFYLWRLPLLMPPSLYLPWQSKYLLWNWPVSWGFWWINCHLVVKKRLNAALNEKPTLRPNLCFPRPVDACLCGPCANTCVCSPEFESFHISECADFPDELLSGVISYS